MTDFEVRTGDAFDVLPTLPADNVHAVVTDPPYGLAFMGRDWDDFEPKEYQQWCEEWASEVRRVLKPGGHLLAFSGNRTHHRLFSGVEDAGFEIRDTITWHYGSGFPKALDVSKAIDKAADAEREVVGEKDHSGAMDGSSYDAGDRSGSMDGVHQITAPATDAAAEWAGFKTALKPATEYVVVARKPLSERTVAANVQTHGTGALNIDGTRIETDGRPKREAKSEHSDGDTLEMGTLGTSEATGETTEGRYPSNVVFDEEIAERLDRENEHRSGSIRRGSDGGFGESNRTYGDDDHDGLDPNRGFDDSGGPSRYFYTSKASRSERTENGRLPNDHPTVKPLDLMEWLVRLVTAEGQTVCDPFAGSGTTLKAAKELGRGAIGIERQPEYADLARARAGLTPEDPSRFVDDGATTLQAYTDGGGGDD